MSTRASAFFGAHANGSRWIRDPLRDAFVLAGLAYVGLILFGIVGGGPDGLAYWSNRLPNLYSATGYGSEAGFYYSPAVAQLVAPLTVLSWPAFHALLVACSLGALLWMLGRWAALALLFPPVAIELYSANVNLIIAAAMVVGFRYPAAWAFPILTKVAPGIGLLWFAVRRQWRELTVALGATAAIVAVSFLLAPDLWLQWIELLTSNVGKAAPGFVVPVPLWARLPAAIALLVWGALTDRRWVVPIAATLAIPILWPAHLSLLVACIPLAAPRGAR